MKTPGKERQKKYIQKQREAGKCSVTILLTRAAKDIVDREREKTGETLSEVLERSILNLKNMVTSDASTEKVPPEKVTSDKIVPKKAPDIQKSFDFFS